MRQIIGAVALGALAVGGAASPAGAAGTVYDRKTRKKVYRQ